MEKSTEAARRTPSRESGPPEGRLVGGVGPLGTKPGVDQARKIEGELVSF